MLLYAGIDEAGYGPMFGPLCVAMVLLEVSDADPADGAPPLWDTLDAVVGHSLKEARGRIVVDDSKRLKGARGARGHPLRHLERGVLGFLGAGATDDDSAAVDLPETDRGLFERLGAGVPPRRWYDADVALPVGVDTGSLRIDAARLRRGLTEAGVRVRAMRVEIVDAAELNAGVDRSGSKAAVNMEAALRLVDAARRAVPGEHPRVILDRHGGRTRYRSELARAWPGSRVDVVVEHPDLSRYRVADDLGEMTVSFAKEADGQHLPVALASMTAKYVRELLMIRLNRWFTGHQPDLRPTAGYVQDGRRYLAEIEPLIGSLDLDRHELIRRT
jgi:hypothetical protein